MKIIYQNLLKTLMSSIILEGEICCIFFYSPTVIPKVTMRRQKTVQIAGNILEILTALNLENHRGCLHFLVPHLCQSCVNYNLFKK